jgi:hypothetical protein
MSLSNQYNAYTFSSLEESLELKLEFGRFVWGKQPWGKALGSK